jgi:hypothetical protein
MGGAWPPEIMARLCKATNSGVHMNLPMMIDLYAWGCRSSDSRMYADVWSLQGGGAGVPFPDGTEMFFPLYPENGIMPTSGMELGPYLIINRNLSDNTWQLARPSAPTTPITFTNTVTPNWDRLITRRNNYQAIWNAFVQRFYSVYPECPEITAEPGNECWNGTYWHGAVEQSVIAYLYNGNNTRTLHAGICHAHATRMAWKAVENFYPRARHVRGYMAQAVPNVFALGIQTVESPINPVFDAAGTTKLGMQLDAISIAPYMDVYHAVQNANNAAIDWYGTTFWPNPYEEPGPWTRDEIVADWQANGPWSTARWEAEQTNIFWNYNFYCRLWRNEMVSAGRTWGTWFMDTYEMGQHFRRDRTGDYVYGDIYMQIQDSFIAYWYGPAGAGIRAKILNWCSYNNVRNLTYYNAASWSRTNRQLDSWGIVPWYGAEDMFPQYGHTLAWHRSLA